MNTKELNQTIALYVHVPFCRARCTYCDFNTYAGLDGLMPRYTAAVCREIEAAAARWVGYRAATIYFGGGTPSLLPPDLLADVLNAARRAFDVPAQAEITLEANPGTVTRAHLTELHTLGVNRLSLGVQSAQEAELRMLGRIHTWEEAVKAVRRARKAGFENLNLDLIFGLPGQMLARWKETLAATLALEPEHLSLSSLILEEKTPLGRRVIEGVLPAPDDDEAADMYELAEEMLAAAGFIHYEISNWARTPAHTSRHNLVYWHNEPWLGMGAGAHSWMDGRRWANVCRPHDYIEAIEASRDPVGETETIDRRTSMGETMMMGLRLDEGVTDERFRARFGVGLTDIFGRELRELAALGLLAWDEKVARLTARGRLLGNQVFAQFV